MDAGRAEDQGSLARRNDDVHRGTHLLLATGRTPNTDTLALERAGVELDPKGFVRIDDELRTSAPGIWAVGDVNGIQPFTRVCQEEAKVAFANAFDGARVRMERSALPHAVFTEPEVGSVGLTERDARDRGHDVIAGLVPFERVEKSELTSETAGFIKFVAERGTHRLLGCHIVGHQAADLVYDAVVVIERRGCSTTSPWRWGCSPPSRRGGGDGSGRPSDDRAGGGLRAADHCHSRRRWNLMAFTCPACGAEFESQAQLDTHVSSEHAA